jgi:hypothetical protein
MTDYPQPPSGPVTGSPQPAEDHVAVVSSLGRVGDAASFMRWIIGTTRPAVTVTLGHNDPAARLSMSDAVERAGTGTRYISVGGQAGGDGGSEPSGQRRPESGSFRSIVEEFDVEEDARMALAAGSYVDLLHVPVPPDASSAFDLTTWLKLLGPGATVVFTSAPEGLSQELDRIANEVVPERFRTVRVPLGVGGEALVAQEPVDGSSGSVDVIENVPGAVGSMLALFGDRNAQGQIGETLGLSAAGETFVDRLIERHETERAAFLEALRTYQDLTMQLSDELAAARQGLATQIESARLEREALVREFLDRVDLLAAKVSTGASKHAAELTLKERQLEDAENRVLAYAGLAASAESVVEDLRRSSSWRVTAPLRLFSGLMRRQAARGPHGR